MTTEQMDWLDDKNPKRRPMHEPWNECGTCDWGGCNRWTVAWRWHPAGHPQGDGEWLPVCDRHCEGFRPWWKRLFHSTGKQS